MKYKFTKRSKDLMTLIDNSNCFENIEKFKHKIQTTNIFRNFYTQLIDSEKFIQQNYDLDSGKYNKIEEVSEIPKPSDYNYILKDIQNHIHEVSDYSYTFECNIINRRVKIFFIYSNPRENIKNSLYKILIWLHVISNYITDSSCSKKLNIYIYLTDLLKCLPKNNELINKIHVNTGYTMSCQPSSNIVIYRREEWFKVFIHESIHNLGLDFSVMNNKITRENILKIFPIDSDVKLYEAYTDAWAKIINVILCSYFTTQNINIFDNYIRNIMKLMNLERTHCFLQVIKILEYKGLKYTDLYSKCNDKKKQYYENTSVLSYYILNAVILNDFEKFFMWCIKNNKNILQFDNTQKKQIEFCKFIENNYKTKILLDRINCISELLLMFKNNNTNGSIQELLQNMRKSLCELE
jgi:hypothetical protein